MSEPVALLEAEASDPPSDPLFDLDVIPAIRLKYKRGRELHGEEWVGKRAIYEAHDEALDLGAYLFHELEHGNIHKASDERLMEELIRQTLNLIRGVRIAIVTLEEGEQ